MKKTMHEAVKRTVAVLLSTSMVVTPAWSTFAQTSDVDTSVQTQITADTQIPLTGYLEIEGEDAKPLHHTISEAMEGEYLADYADTLPAYYRNTQVPAVRTQNPYNMCWAFATTALTELSLIKNGYATTDIDLSEAQIANFTYHNVPDALGGKTGDTNANTSTVGITESGGNIALAANALLDWQGVTTESNVPMNADNARLINGKGLDATLAYKDNVAHVQNFYHINASNRADVKEAVYKYGGASISYYANTRVSGNTSHAYYNSDKSAYYCYDSK